MKVTTRIKYLKHELEMLEEDLAIAEDLHNYATILELKIAGIYINKKISELTELYDIKEDK